MKLFTGMKFHCLTTCVLGLLLFKPSQAHGQQLSTYGFTGHVVSITDPLNITNGSISIGGGVSGSYTFSDSPTFVDYSQPNTADYVFLYDPLFRPTGMSLKIGSALLDGVTIFPFLNISITNDDPSRGDQYTAFQQTAYPGAFTQPGDPSLGGIPPSFPEAGIILQDPSGLAFTSQDLPLGPPDLTKFSQRLGIVTVLNVDTGDVIAEVEFSLDSLQAVPEPNESALLGCLIVASLIQLWIRRQTLSRVPSQQRIRQTPSI